MANYLLEKGANINAIIGFSNINALMRVIEKENLVMVLYLIGKNADINARNSCALYKATLVGNLDIVKILIENGSEINNKAISTAASYGDVDILEYFIENGANIKMKLYYTRGKERCHITYL